MASLPRSGGREVTREEVARLAAIVGLPLDPESAAAVAEQLTGLLDFARLFVEFPLPDDVEPPAIFRP
jgi:Asp-tRNA(Asn)/Glu-tRNA(Gln) amidotransferase C subunit